MVATETDAADRKTMKVLPLIWKIAKLIARQADLMHEAEEFFADARMHLLVQARKRSATEAIANADSKTEEEGKDLAWACFVARQKLRDNVRRVRRIRAKQRDGQDGAQIDRQCCCSWERRKRSESRALIAEEFRKSLPLELRVIVRARFDEGLNWTECEEVFSTHRSRLAKMFRTAAKKFLAKRM